jgi:hypothetical protein
MFIGIFIGSVIWTLIIVLTLVGLHNAAKKAHEIKYSNRGGRNSG